MDERNREQGINAFRTGNRALAFKYLTNAIRENPQDETAWLWLAACVDSDEKKRYCLQRVLAINPSQSSARRALLQMDAPPLGRTTPTNDASENIAFTVEQKPLSSSEPGAAGFTLPRFTIFNRRQASPDKRESSKERQLKKDYRRYTMSLVSLSAFLILATLGITYLLQPGLFSTQTISKGAPIWLDADPSPDEIDRAKALAENFENPLNFTYQEIGTLSALQQLSGVANPVVFNGKLVRGFQIDDLGGGKAYVLEISLKNDILLVLYRGYIGNLELDDKIKIEGLYLPQIQGISAHKIILQGRPRSSAESNDIGLLRWAVLDIVLILFSLTLYFWSSTTKKWRKALKKHAVQIVMILPMLSIVGCTVDFSTIIFSDGSGFITVTARESKENMDFMREIPGMRGYLDALSRQLQTDGLQIMQWNEDASEVFFLQRPFAYVGDLSRQKASTIMGSWIAVQEYQEDGWKVIRYLALVDTTTLFRETPGISSEASNEIHNQMSQVQMTYSVALPGNISYHNAASINGNKISWQIGMNEKNPLVAEARIPIDTVGKENWRVYVQYGLMIILIICCLFVISAFLNLKSSNREVKGAQKQS